MMRDTADDVRCECNDQTSLSSAYLHEKTIEKQHSRMQKRVRTSPYIFSTENADMQNSLQTI